MEQERPSTLQWTDREAASGEVFRLGRDVGLRDGEFTLRIEASVTPDADYREGAVAAVRELSQRWGGPVVLVLDFVGYGPPGPGESLKLCRDLVATESLAEITLLHKPWMPRLLVSGVVKVLKGVGVPVSLVEAS
tara:strand:+ start:876 stop:1280 length:405 start_codon:yes stop_codon:yes gene_type:complete